MHMVIISLFFNLYEGVESMVACPSMVISPSGGGLPGRRQATETQRNGEQVAKREKSPGGGGPGGAAGRYSRCREMVRFFLHSPYTCILELPHSRHLIAPTDH